MKATAVLIAACVTMGLCGCKSGQQQADLLNEVGTLKLENQELASKLAESEAQAGRLEGRVKTLEELGANVRTEGLFRLESVKITRYTGLYEEEGKETLIVYLQPIDESGDVIKAGGEVDVQLWDLDKAPDEALLGEWRVSAEELKGLWFMTLFSSYYRLTFDVSEKVAEYRNPLTVRVKFIDYLSGKTFTEERTIEQ